MKNDFPRFIPTGNVECITPEIAKEYLNHNDKNPRKNINSNTVDAYARDIKSGNFFLNGESIVFDANGDLKDGQHRLLAIIKANTPCYVYVIRGIDPAVTTFDYGRQRRMYQELGCNSNLETLTNIIVNNVYAKPIKAFGTIKQYIIDHNNELTNAVRIAGKGVSKRPIGLKREVYTMIYLLLRTNYATEYEMEQFMYVVNTGLPLERESSPAIIFRNKLLGTKNVRNNRAETLERMSFMFCAVNDFQSGNRRARPYIIKTTEFVEGLVRRVRIMDGLEGNVSE